MPSSSNVREQIDAELAVGERVFARLLAENRERLSHAARIMAADYELLEAVARDHQEAAVPVLASHGGRIKADMTLLRSGTCWHRHLVTPQRLSPRSYQRCRRQLKYIPSGWAMTSSRCA